MLVLYQRLLFFSQETSTVQPQAEKAEDTLEFLYRHRQTGWCMMQWCDFAWMMTTHFLLGIEEYTPSFPVALIGSTP